MLSIAEAITHELFHCIFGYVDFSYAVPMSAYTYSKKSTGYTFSGFCLGAEVEKISESIGRNVFDKDALSVSDLWFDEMGDSVTKDIKKGNSDKSKEKEYLGLWKFLNVDTFRVAYITLLYYVTNNFNRREELYFSLRTKDGQGVIDVGDSPLKKSSVDGMIYSHLIVQESIYSAGLIKINYSTEVLGRVSEALTSRRRSLSKKRYFEAKNRFSENYNENRFNINITDMEVAS